MKKFFFYIIPFLLLSCATLMPEINENDKNLHMIGGKESLLDAIIYPDIALEKGVEGIVNIMVYVDTLGLVKECEIIDGNEYLNEAAIKALKAQKFHPYYINGKKSPVRVAFPISFFINNHIDINLYEQKRLLPQAEEILSRPIRTLNYYISERSPGGLTNYYSEGLTWWPNILSPKGPYIIKDNKVNPHAFLDHKKALSQASETISSLTTLYLSTKNPDYAIRALEHVQAWFLDENTAMVPDMKFAQSIPNRSKGRASGIYDAMPLLEIIQSVDKLRPFMEKNDIATFEQWLKDYSKFIIYDDFGVRLREKKNTYGTAWLAQMLSISHFLDDKYLMKTCREYFESITLPYVLSDDSHLLRTPDKQLFEYDPLIHADYLAVIARLLTDKNYNAWKTTDKNGRCVGDLINYIYSGLLNKRINQGEFYRGRFIFFYLAGEAYDNNRYLDLWLKLQSNDMDIDFPIDNVLLWR